MYKQTIALGEKVPIPQINLLIQSLHMFQVVEDACNGNMIDNLWREQLTVEQVIIASQAGRMYAERAYGEVEQ